MSNPNYIKTGGSWVNVSELHCKSGGGWVEADEAYKKVGGSWVKFYDKHTVASNTDYVRVNLAEFDEDDDCACTLTGTLQIWYTGGQTFAVDDWVDDSIYCAKIIAINVPEPGGGGTGDSSVYGGVHDDCDACNDSISVCSPLDDGGGGGPSGPGGPGGYCLLPDMLVKRASGSLVRVEDLEIGDFIRTEDGLTQVESLIKDHPREGHYIIEDELYITDDHPMSMDGQVFRAELYKGKKEYVEGKVNTIYVGTVDSFFSVFCKNNVYSVSGSYGKNKSK